MESDIAAPQLAKTPPVTVQNTYSVIKNYYDVAGPDYEMWSRNFNMHFGYLKKFTDIFSLEKMLVNMNAEVLKRLEIPIDEEASVADLGCGVGTVARYAATHLPLANITGVTISNYQITKANELIVKEGLEEQVKIVCSNFESLDFADETFTHAYALESACHANSHNKELFIAEMARTLRKGGRFCIADGFLKPAAKRPKLFTYLYNRVTKFWAVPSFANIDEFTALLWKYGLKDITVKEISYQIAPSVLYVPWTCIKFFANEIWKNRSLKMKKERWENVYAPVLGMFLGLFRKHFGYYIISGRK